MTFKTSPKAYRAQRMEDWESHYFAEDNLRKFLQEDYEIREFIKKKYKRQAMIEKIVIKRIPGKIKVIIFTARPGLVIGRGGEEIEKLKNQIEDKILKRKGELDIEIQEVKEVWASAPLVAQWIASQLEKRLPYRRVLKHALSRIMSQKNVQGAKLQVSGRLDGVEIARTEWLKEGKLPRTTVRSDIDYACEPAQTRVGIIGVKVWIYKGEREL